MFSVPSGLTVLLKRTSFIWVSLNPVCAEAREGGLLGSGWGQSHVLRSGACMTEEVAKGSVYWECGAEVGCPGVRGL